MGENVERESEIVSQAGRLGAVTVATNMAGRGTDILLGGSPKGIARVLAKHLMLVKLGLSEQPPILPDTSPQEQENTESDEESEVVEEETDEDVLSLPSVRDLAASLELWMPGKLSQMAELNLKRAVISCLDSIGPDANRLEIEDIVAKAADNAPVDDVAVKLLRKGLSKITSELENMIKLEREKVKRLGGLYVIGTSRHESRRIDNQLRGRAGRQGDPGGTRFFLSLEDDIFVTFGGDKMGDVLEKFRVAEDMPIENDLVMQALDKVQEKVEAYFAANRRQVFKLDEVMSTQRDTIYQRRARMLTADPDNTRSTLREWCVETMDDLVRGSQKGNDVDVEALHGKAVQFFGSHFTLTVAEMAKLNSEGKLAEKLTSAAEAASESKLAALDSKRAGLALQVWRYLCLVQIDLTWSKHLVSMNGLKETVQMRKYEGLDPLKEYQASGVELFQQLLVKTRRDSIYSFFAYS